MLSGPEVQRSITSGSCSWRTYSLIAPTVFFPLKKSYCKSEAFWQQNIWKASVRRKEKKWPKIQITFYKSWGQNLCLSISVSTKTYSGLEDKTINIFWMGGKAALHPTTLRYPLLTLDSIVYEYWTVKWLVQMSFSLPHLSHGGKLTASFVPSTGDVVLPAMFSGSSLPWPSVSSQRDGKGRRVYQMPHTLPTPPQRSLRGRKLVYLKSSPLDRGKRWASFLQPSCIWFTWHSFQSSWCLDLFHTN